MMCTHSNASFEHIKKNWISIYSLFKMGKDRDHVVFAHFYYMLIFSGILPLKFNGHEHNTQQKNKGGLHF